LAPETVRLESREPGIPPPEITFDRCFDGGTSQETFFSHTAEPLATEVLAGFNVTVLAYGQTGSGKTHTMMGEPASASGAGVIPRLVLEIFRLIGEAPSGVEFTVKVAYVEIYNEKVYDLLSADQGSRRELPLRQTNASNVWVEGLSEYHVGDAASVLDQLEAGGSNRALASTAMNDQSSRSHAVFFLTLAATTVATGARQTSRLVLVDLAGSEKVRKTGATGDTLKEAQNINRSLSALGNVINALTKPRRKGKAAPHVPYRDSKLTRLLQPSLGGNAKTCLLIAASPSRAHLRETTAALRFGERAKSMKNRATVNREHTAAEYKALLAAANETIRVLRGRCQTLEAALRGAGVPVPPALASPPPELPPRDHVAVSAPPPPPPPPDVEKGPPPFSGEGGGSESEPEPELEDLREPGEPGNNSGGHHPPPPPQQEGAVPPPPPRARQRPPEPPSREPPPPPPQLPDSSLLLAHVGDLEEQLAAAHQELEREVGASQTAREALHDRIAELEAREDAWPTLPAVPPHVEEGDEGVVAKQLEEIARLESELAAARSESRQREEEGAAAEPPPVSTKDAGYTRFLEVRVSQLEDGLNPAPPTRRSPETTDLATVRAFHLDVVEALYLETEAEASAVPGGPAPPPVLLGAFHRVCCERDVAVEKLENTQKVCDKLLKSGIYWRQQRQRTTASRNVSIPMRGGGEPG
jgi:hypothetical protein